MKIEKFEDLNAWQEARKLNHLVYEMTRTKIIKLDYDLARHMRKTSISIMANIAEGFGRYSFKDKKQFFTIARGSIAELKSHCYVALDEKFLTEPEFERLYKQSEIVGKLVSGLIKVTRSKGVLMKEAKAF